MDTPETLLPLLLAAITVALAARRLRLPYTVGLVVAGIGLALAHIHTGVALTHALIFNVILPPLLFEAAICLRWRAVRRDLAPILVLAVLGVAISAAFVAWGLTALLGWQRPAAALFGMLIAATDPVSVIALFKDLRITGRLRCLVEAESLLNDGVAAVLFTLTLAWAESGVVPSPASAAGALALTAGGGTALGLAIGALTTAIAGRSKDHLVETALTLLAAYGSFALAEHLHLSGVLATVAAGLVVGNTGLRSVGARHAAFDFWEFAAFLANSLVFLLIGLAVAAIPLGRLGAGALATIIALVLAGRALTVYPICLAFSRTSRAIPLAEQHILWWGGLRGALALALVLALPQALPGHDDILIATFGTVTFSVLAQGVSMRAVLRMVGVKEARPGALPLDPAGDKSPDPIR
jgi:CPA1 family monovalent cation:H+ antiporter